MALYVLNTPVLTDWGTYKFTPITLEEAKALLQEENFVSAIGHEATAQLMTRLTGITIPVNRVQVKMGLGDMAIVFRVLVRLPEGKVVSEQELQSIPFEFGVLEKTGE